MVGIPVLMLGTNTSGSKWYVTFIVAYFSSFVGSFTD
jgi:hypothetical protein